MSTSLDPDVIVGLRELEADADTGFVAQIFGLFLSSVTERVPRMEAAVQKSDREGVKAEAHSLKSSAGNIGAMTLSAICQKLEDYGKASHELDAVQVLTEFKAELERVVSDIRQLPEMQKASQ